MRAGSQGYRLKIRPNEWRAAIFTVYNRKVAEHAQLFPIFHSFEIAFRSTLAVELERHYRHARWWVAIYNELRAGRNPKNITQVGGVPINRHAAYRIGQIIRDIDGPDLRRGVVPSLGKGFEFMRECDLIHIRQLVEEHWTPISAVYSLGTLNDFTAKFDRVRDARNEVYHHKSVAGMTAVIHAAEELLDRLHFSLQFVYHKVSSCTPQAPTFLLPIEPKRHRTW